MIQNTKETMQKTTKTFIFSKKMLVISIKLNIQFKFKVKLTHASYKENICRLNGIIWIKQAGN